jgi:hypothetical protein
VLSKDTAPIAPDPQQRNGTAWKSELRAKKINRLNLADGGGPPSKDPVVQETESDSVLSQNTSPSTSAVARHENGVNGTPSSLAEIIAPLTRFPGVLSASTLLCQ